MSTLAPTLTYKGWNSNGQPLAFGLLYTYAAGTTTPQATYIDNSQTTQNTNPITLNSRGECQLWLDPTLSYKFIQTDSAGNPMGPTVDNVTGMLYAANLGNLVPSSSDLYTLGTPTISWANAYFGPSMLPIINAQGGIGYTPIQPFETAAGVTAIYGYWPGFVDRYAVNTTPPTVVNSQNVCPTGTTDMTNAWNLALAVAQQVQGVDVTYFGTSNYMTTAALNGTFPSGANQFGIKIRPLGGPSLDYGHGIVANHTQVAVFDFTGCDGVVMEDVVIHTTATSFPQVGVLLARNSTGGSVFHRLRNVRILGYFSVACYYNFGAESQSIDACYFQNNATSANTKTHVVTQSNSAFALTSPYTTIYASPISTTDISFRGCQYVNNAATSTTDCGYVEGACGGVNDTDGYAYTLAGRALYYFDMTLTAPYNCSIQRLKGDYNATSMQLYGVNFSNHVQTPSAISIRDCYLPTASLGYAISATGTNPILDGFYIENIDEHDSHGIYIPGTLEYSSLNIGETLLTLGTSKQNVLIGASEQWTITTRLNDNWIDTGTVNKSFAPGIVSGAAGWTAVGTLFQSGNLLYSGNQANFEITVQGATTIAATDVATITLPFTAIRATYCSLYYGTTVIGCSISGTTLTVLTAITATSDVLYISGQVFVA